ncbi:MAG TPA: hypothetical protein VHE37_07115 [Nevskiaceae bacterium]|nr:hypothetical protein [Nevskiaceae bacterium]
MKPLSPLLAVLLLAACAADDHTPAGACHAEAGRRWSYLQLPPVNSAELIKLTDLRAGSPVVWFERGGDRLYACSYPRMQGCAPETYEFARDDGFWQVRSHQAAGACTAAR